MTNENKKLTKSTPLRAILKSDEFVQVLTELLKDPSAAKRMARITITAASKMPALAECSQASVLNCLFDLAAYGLDPDGRLAHLIPFKDRNTNTVICQLIIDYKGIVELMYRNGAAKNIHADVVREGDLFEYNKGQVISHVPWFLRRDAKPRQPGKVYAVYVEVMLSNGATKCEVMSYDDIESVRKRSKAGTNGPWKTDWPEMAKKTVFRRCSKWLPLSPELREVINIGADTFDTIEGSVAPPRTIPAAEFEKILAERERKGIEEKTEAPEIRPREEERERETVPARSEVEESPERYQESESLPDVDEYDHDGNPFA